MVRKAHRLTIIVAALWLPGLIIGCTPLAHHPEFAEKLSATMHRLDAEGSILAARVVELPSGRELFAENPDEPFIPASNLKLLISAVGLDRFGAQHAFKTYLARSGEDVWIVGTGDPGLGDPRIAAAAGRRPDAVLHEWAQALAVDGRTRIEGDLCYDGSYFEATEYHPAWNKGDLVHWYAAPVSGLNFNDNCIDVTVWPSADGISVEYDVVPWGAAVTFVNACSTGMEETTATIARRPHENVYELRGAVTRKESLQSTPVIDPAAFLAQTLRAALQSRGIELGGTVRRISVARDADGAPTGCEILAVHETSMPALLWRIGKNSQNLFAECLAKSIGRDWSAERGFDRPGSWADASRAMGEWLSANGIDTNGLVVDDGSGLSRRNRVTARTLTDLLAVMFNHRDGDLYRSSLAEGGVDGTLARRMPELKGRVYAKTGYIGGVRSLSGYVKTRFGSWLAFSFLYNKIPGSVEPYEALQDEGCGLLADWEWAEGPHRRPKATTGTPG